MASAHPLFVALLFSLSTVPAWGQSPSPWRVVQPADGTDAPVRCLSRPGWLAITKHRLAAGALVQVGTSRGNFIQVVRTPGRTQGALNCWVNLRSLATPPSSVQGGLYTGSYRLAQGEPLTCHQGMGDHTPPSPTTYSPGTRIEATDVGVDSQGQTWFRTQSNCYIPARLNQLQWAGQGEDPNTMCNYLEESC